MVFFDLRKMLGQALLKKSGDILKEGNGFEFYLKRAKAKEQGT